MSINPIDGPTVTPGQLANALGLSVSTVKRLTDRAVIHAHRTAGGHRRILVAEALRFAHERGIPIRFSPAIAEIAAEHEVPPARADVETARG